MYFSQLFGFTACIIKDPVTPSGPQALCCIDCVGCNCLQRALYKRRQFFFVFRYVPTFIEVRLFVTVPVSCSSSLPFCLRQSVHLQAVLITCNVAECKLGVRPQVSTDAGLLPVKQRCLPNARGVAVCKMNYPFPSCRQPSPRRIKVFSGGPFNGRGDVATWITIRMGLVSAFG